MVTYTLTHNSLTEAVIIDSHGTERGARAWATHHILLTFDHMIGVKEWSVTTA